MKVAFVGKGGSGKTTVSALFSQYSSTKLPTLLVDADINVNLPSVLEVDPPESLSSTESIKAIRSVLLGQNPLVKNLNDFKKSTPPARGSTIVRPASQGVAPLEKFTLSLTNNLDLAVVGTYTGEGVGTSCYHNNLAILENILSHTDDRDAAVVVDMVAGTDAFASTLHAQFDMLIVVVEPTKKSLDVFKNFFDLACAAGVESRVFAVFNKVLDDEDKEFLQERIKKDRILGALSSSKHISLVDKGREKLDFDLLDESSKQALESIFDKAKSSEIHPNDKLPKLWELHLKYVGQDYVAARHGDLSSQIDRDFRY